MASILSVDSNINVLRNRLWQEIQRRRQQKHKQRQIDTNIKILNNVGKRRRKRHAAASDERGLLY